MLSSYPLLVENESFYMKANVIALVFWLVAPLVVDILIESGIERKFYLFGLFCGLEKKFRGSRLTWARRVIWWQQKKLALHCIIVVLSF